MDALVGYTGFVGSNICSAHSFDAVYNSKNIEKAYGTAPDLLVYAGLRAEKYLADDDPAKDLQLIGQAEENIKRIAPKKLILLSTIDVFRSPKDVDEDSRIETKGLRPYGYHRYQLELWVRERYPDALIVRLPGLFGKNIKKNFIYDFMDPIPSMLRGAKMEELSQTDPSLKDHYLLQDNGFYRVKDLTKSERAVLKNKFRAVGFDALHFTDSRSVFQFYDLNRLWDDIQTVLDHGIDLWHPATEPVSAGELYRYLTGEDFVNRSDGAPAYYDYRTIHSEIFGRKDGYICGKEEIMAAICRFVKEMRPSEAMEGTR